MNSPDSDSFASFERFWPRYLAEHARPGTRALHYTGTALAGLVLLVALIARIWWLLLLVPVAGYLFAWIGHWRIEKNRPATFTHPLWSLAGDIKMFALALSGRLRGELRAQGIDPATGARLGTGPGGGDGEGEEAR